ncbi:MAG: hypothetical protein CMH55_05395 [Myxococcales bacterium]|nr:hypothetical protein [Myxococcales bacterium]
MRTLGLFLLLPAAGFLTACPAQQECDGGGLTDSFHATGSRSAVTSADQRIVYVVNTDHNSITRFNRESGLFQRIEAGSAPNRIAIAGDRVFVTLKGQRGLAVFKETGETLELLNVVDTGAEPAGLVANEAGTLLYLTSGQSGRVEERSVASLEVQRQWEIGNEPRWLALHPSGNTLFVASAMNGRLNAIDLLDDGGVTEVGLPQIRGFDDDSRSVRITGDIAIDVDGERLLVPTFYVDNMREVPTNPHSGDIDCEEGCGDVDTGDDYGSTINPRFVPALVSVPVSAMGRPEPSSAVVTELSGQAQVIQGEDRHEFRTVVRGFPTGVTPSPDGRLALVSMESANAVLAVPLARFPNNRCVFGTPKTRQDDQGRVSLEMDEVFMGEFGQFLTIPVGSGPQSVTFNSDGEAMVHTRFDHGLSKIDMDAVVQNLGRRTVISDGALIPQTIRMAPRALSDEHDRGRRLFFSSVDSTVSAQGSGVSCSACHFDGRNDGLTWQFDDGLGRSTPSLAGDVSRTEPISWFDNVPTVADEILSTSQNRMGGTEIDQGTVDAIAAFVNSTPEVDTENRGQESALIAEGRALFHSDRTACSTCHSNEDHPEIYTDNQIHQVFGRSVRTRSLNGIAASAPYFHDGSAATLYEVLDRAKDCSMGCTGDLSDRERDAMVAFLKSL